MSKLLAKKSMYDLQPKLGKKGPKLEDFTTYGTDKNWDRDAELGAPNNAPFNKPDHLKRLLKKSVKSKRQGNGTQDYVADVGGTNVGWPNDMDLERTALYPNYDDNFGTPGADSTYENHWSTIDPDAKF